jgi:hypothetical protein
MEQNILLDPPLKFGLAMADGSMKPVYFEGPMSPEFLQDLICSCKGKNACSKSCMYYINIYISSHVSTSFLRLQF